jgi:rare lipoprotein A
MSNVNDIIGRLWVVGVGIFAMIAGCAIPPARVSVPSLAPTPAVQTGIASWYGPGFHGKPTASGAIYDQHEMTAAHQTLPLGTRVMVTNLEKGKSIEVTINDRGPFAKGRVIDLSYASAQSLGMVEPGTIPVRIEVLGPERFKPIRANLDYTLQAGSFAQMANAQKLMEQVTRTYPELSEVSIVPFQAKDSTFYRVQIGLFSNRDEAESQARQLASKGFQVVIMEK